jgi:hypothetical protein
MDAQCQRGCVRPDSQDVGLEAAIIERVRNSSLVEYACTDNVARLKHPPEAVDRFSTEAVVGERCVPPRSPTARTGGAHTSANAGMSSVMDV